MNSAKRRVNISDIIGNKKIGKSVTVNDDDDDGDTMVLRKVKRKIVGTTVKEKVSHKEEDTKLEKNMNDWFPTLLKKRNPERDSRRLILYKISYLGMLMDGEATEQTSKSRLEKALYKEFNKLSPKQMMQTIKKLEGQLSRLKV